MPVTLLVSIDQNRGVHFQHLGVGAAALRNLNFEAIFEVTSLGGTWHFDQADEKDNLTAEFSKRKMQEKVCMCGCVWKDGWIMLKRSASKHHFNSASSHLWLF